MESETTPLHQRSTSLQYNLHIWRREEARQRDLRRGGAFFLALCVISLIIINLAEHLDDGKSKTADPQVEIRAATQPDPANTTALDNQVYCGLTIQDSGCIKLPNNGDDHFTYWYFESRNQPSTDPLVLWLTGGFECSSMVAMLTENGPCHVLPDLTTKLNPYSWTNKSNVVWLTAVGIIHGDKHDTDNNEDKVGENIYYFLQEFFQKHPELANRDFYITGESYGGHYVPVAAHYVWQKNKQIAGTTFINLKGIAIGNGLVQAAIQMPHYIDMAIKNAYNISLVDKAQLDEMKAVMPNCKNLLEQCSHKKTACGTVEDYCIQKLFDPMLKAKRNPYDIRLPCKTHGVDTEFYDMSYVSEYINAPNVREFLGLDSKLVGEWQQSNLNIHDALLKSASPAKPFDSYVADLLNAGVRVLIYAGDADLVCNWHGIEAWTLALQWKGKDGFNAAQETSFITTNGTTAGLLRSFANQLTFLRIFSSGHFMLKDQPAVALDMLNKFLASDNF
ncbi:serine protease family [Plasmopara halstedii]|uniref:Carboxypeptidase n=1 Tax=Plasmopara halstedii TaxID=4781 RepID=A0A0P1B3W5_PLAHL|nr:serine protease family [Plasmopara halstedii]CEG48350.1 serine protease family [Plasmopara halstedii]|eukprot:XP_024584719.1 serine protease family [Plasmopara halstedii]